MGRRLLARRGLVRYRRGTGIECQGTISVGHLWRSIRRGSWPPCFPDGDDDGGDVQSGDAGQQVVSHA